MVPSSRNRPRRHHGDSTCDLALVERGARRWGFVCYDDRSMQLADLFAMRWQSVRSRLVVRSRFGRFRGCSRFRRFRCRFDGRLHRHSVLDTTCFAGRFHCSMLDDCRLCHRFLASCGRRGQLLHCRLIGHRLFAGNFLRYHLFRCWLLDNRLLGNSILADDLFADGGFLRRNAFGCCRLLRHRL